MRLFLASASVCGQVPQLTDLVGPGAVVAVSANALDADDALRAGWLEREVTALAAAGLSPIELDLRDYYRRPEGLQAALAGVDMIWATGGNVFVLRKALQRSGLDALLQESLRADALAYGGSSAGGCICAPSLRGIELVEDAEAAGEPIFAGLGLVDFAIVPHVGADGGAGEAMERLVDYFRLAGVPYRPLRDGQAIVVRDGRTTTIELY